MTVRVRWRSADATGPVIPGAGVLYFARLVGKATGSGDAIVVLRDSAAAVTGTAGVMLALRITAAIPADDWPKAPVAVAFESGVTAEFVSGGGSAVLVLGWDTR